jgi:sigma-B regulation protein RsbU (phosphoserine phosphatase)
VSGPLVRRLRLPAVASSPAAARHAVADLLHEAGLDDLRDEALLLTSELVTNGVVHARSETEVEVVADPRGVRVTVTDFGATGSPLVLAEAVATQQDPAVGGRGLLLVNQFASGWGTHHQPTGRAVWFRLDRDGDGGHPVEVLAPPGARTTDDVIRAVVGTAADHEGVDTVPQLLSRLATALAADTATVTVDRADGAGDALLARFESTEPPARRGRMFRVPLRLSRPWRGELSITGARVGHAQAIAELTAGQMALLIENQRLEAAHDERRGWLLYLAEAGELLAQSMNVELTAALVPRLIVPRLGLWCAVHMLSEYGELTLAALTHADETAIGRLGTDVEDMLPALRRAMDSDGLVPLPGPREGIAFPLTVRGEQLGTLSVGRPAGRAHLPDELAVISDLGRRTVLAIDNARVHDNRSRITTTLQRSLLPPQLPAIEGLEVAGQYVPAGAGLDVGGDFYDVMALPDQGWLLVVGDVSGKGAGAAAVTGLVREVLHTLALDYQDPAHTLTRLNATLVERGGGYFCTLALALLTAIGPGIFDVSLHLAGHDQPVLLRADGSTSLVGDGGTALGLLDQIKTPRTTIRLDRGDALVFYTDGVTERRRGTILYGQRRLRSAIAALAGSPAAVLASQLRASVMAFSPNTPRDDIAILALRAM